MTDHRWSQFGLMLSAGAHAAVFGAALVWGDFFRPPDEDPTQLVDTAFVSEAELAALQENFESLTPPEPSEPPENPVFAEPTEAEPPPPPPEPEPERAEPDPAEPVESAGPAPYESLPAPADLALDPRATEDRSADKQIREALPAVRPREAPEQIETAVEDAAPEVERAADEPPAEEEVAEKPKPRIEQAPEQPVAENRDREPEADTPDTPPEPREAAPQEPEPKPEPETRVASVAPKTAPTPRLRPRRAAQPKPKPKPPAEDSFFDDLDQALQKIPEGVARPREERPRRRGRSAPLSAGERSNFQAAFRKNWVRVSPGPDLGQLTVVLEMTLAEDGSILDIKRIEPTVAGRSARQDIAVQNAVRALQLGAPYSQGPIEKYDRWRRIRVTFDLALGRTTIN